LFSDLDLMLIFMAACIILVHVITAGTTRCWQEHQFQD